MNVKVARLLGWFSIGIGLVEMASPGALGRYLGLDNRRGLIRAYGLRELTAGIALLAGGPRMVQWLWNRVGGDIMDIVTLAPATTRFDPRRKRARGAMAAVAGITALDIFEALFFSSPDRARLLAAPDSSADLN